MYHLVTSNSSRIYEVYPPGNHQTSSTNDTFESMIFLFPRWDMGVVPRRVGVKIPLQRDCQVEAQKAEQELRSCDVFFFG